MQFDMYHHYTVDEHTIRAIGLLADIEQNRLKEDHPLSTVIMDQIHSRRVIYCAVLLHDIAKGRGGDHSVLGAALDRKRDVQGKSVSVREDLGGRRCRTQKTKRKEPCDNQKYKKNT